MTPLHAHAQYICTVFAKYQKASVKALVQVDFPVYALSKQKQNKEAGEKWLSSQSCHFIKNWVKFWSRKVGYFAIQRKPCHVLENTYQTW